MRNPRQGKRSSKSTRGNWEKATLAALTFTLAIPASSALFCQQIAIVAVSLAASATAKGGKWLVKYFAGYAIGRSINATQAKQIQHSLTAEGDD